MNEKERELIEIEWRNFYGGQVLALRDAVDFQTNILLVLTCSILIIAGGFGFSLLEKRFHKGDNAHDKGGQSEQVIPSGHAAAASTGQLVFGNNTTQGSRAVACNEREQLIVRAGLPFCDVCFGLVGHATNATQLTALSATQEATR